MTTRCENELTNILTRYSQVCHMNSKINIIDESLLKCIENRYLNTIDFEYIDAYVIICGQVFTLQIVSLPNRLRDDKTPRTIEAQRDSMIGY